MSMRLQVVVEETELAAIRAAAVNEGLTVSEWVRIQLRQARRRVSSGDVDRKLAAIRAADRLEYPTADIDVMLAHIEDGYGESGE